MSIQSKPRIISPQRLPIEAAAEIESAGCDGATFAAPVQVSRRCRRRAGHPSAIASACFYAALLLGSTGTAHALAKAFTGATSSDWFTASNWNPAGVPAATDDVTVASLKTVSLSAATTIQSLALAGSVTGAGDLTVSGDINWSAGTMSGSGVTNASGSLHIVGNVDKHLERTLNNFGVASWTGLGILHMSSTFNNLEGATLTITNDRPLAAQVPEARFNNAGTVVKMGAVQRSIISVAFHNSGVVEVLSGTLALGGGGTHSGRFNPSGGTIELANGNHMLAPSSSISGSSVIFSGGTSVVGGTYEATATTISGGSVTFVGSLAASGALTIANGTVAFDNSEGVVVAPSLLFSAGTITGASRLDIDGLLTWSGGTMTGTGVTNANDGLSVAGSVSKHLDRTLNLAGLGTWTASGILEITSTFNILPGATFEARNDRVFSGVVGRTGSINNAGTFRKTMGTLTTSTSAVSFENSGVVEILSGTLSFTPSYVQSAGITRVMSATTLRSSTPIQINGGRLEGNGTINADIINNADVAPGLSPGRLAATRTYTQNAAAALDIELAGTAVADFDQLTVSGEARLGGALNVTLLPGFTPQPGDRFQILTFASRTGNFVSTSGLTLGAGRGFTEIVGATEVVLQYGVEDCGDGHDNDNDSLGDCADPKCVDFPACAPTPTATATASPTPTITPCSSCTGDCNCDGNVSGVEILDGIAMALDGASLACARFDADLSAAVEVDELVAAVNNAHGTCGAVARLAGDRLDY